MNHPTASSRSPAASSLWGFAAVVALLWIATHFPGAPYNLAKLIDTRFPFGSVLLLAVAIYWIVGAPLALARLLGLRKYRALVLIPLAFIGYGVIAWMLLRLAVPRFMINKVVGSPILDWAWEWEDLARFVALSFVPAVAGAAVAALLGRGIVRADRRRSLAIGLIIAAALLPLAYWAVVEMAATDNLTELVAGGASPAACACLFGYVCIVDAGAMFIVVAARTPPRQRVLCYIAVALTFPVGYLLLKLGTEPALVKYGEVFSAMQFLLSATRRDYAGATELIVRFVVAHGGLLAIVAIAQWPIWLRIRDGSTGADAPAFETR